MKFQKIVKGMAAGAVILMGIVACGNKAEAVSNSSESEARAEEQSAVENDAMADGSSGQENSLEATEAPALDMAVFDHSTPSGLKYRIIEEGTGKSPSATDVVLVDYEGRLTNGTVFDSSYQRQQPISFPLNRVIPGWTEGLQLMKEGAKYEFYIPYNLAYGERGAAPAIPPKADLIFVVELHEVQ